MKEEEECSGELDRWKVDGKCRCEYTWTGGRRDGDGKVGVRVGHRKVGGWRKEMRQVGKRWCGEGIQGEVQGYRGAGTGEENATRRRYDVWGGERLRGRDGWKKRRESRW